MRTFFDITCKVTVLFIVIGLICLSLGKKFVGDKTRTKILPAPSVVDNSIITDMKPFYATEETPSNILVEQSVNNNIVKESVNNDIIEKPVNEVPLILHEYTIDGWCYKIVTTFEEATRLYKEEGYGYVGKYNPETNKISNEGNSWVMTKRAEIVAPQSNSNSRNRGIFRRR